MRRCTGCSVSSLPAYILGTSFREACSIIIGEILRRCFHIEHSDFRFCGLKVTRDCSEEREYCIDCNHWVLRRSMASSHGPIMVQSWSTAFMQYCLSEHDMRECSD